jgi:hypothetical protein
MITQSELKRLLHYDPETGLFTWLVNCGPRKVGDNAGSIKIGYISIRIKKHDYLAHRLAWLYMTGKMPSKYIDHINGKRDDNRFVNLREAEPSENSCNAKTYSHNKSGVKGVSYHKKRKEYHATICKKGKKHFVGWFKSLDEARVAIQAARKNIHGEFANHG